jgi:pyruvate kinase
MSLRRTKLVCTIGPASIERADDLVAAGMDVARINFSHGEPAEHADALDRVRAAAAAAGRALAVMTDLSGPKIRLADLDGGELRLETGTALWIGSGAVETTYPGLAGDLERGDRILLADGAAELRVVAADGPTLRAEVVRGGTVRSGAGVNVPSERLSTPSITERDRVDVPRALELGADYVAQSFVRHASDVEELRGLLGADGPRIVAKIETRPAVDDFAAICRAADAVMIARGDLGVELPYEEVPILQKQLVRHALDAGVPAIVATQMLESMTAAPRPTRAEASDVANAIFDGADAIMLSAETAIGEYPVLAAEAAVRIARLCEDKGAVHLPEGSPTAAMTDADAVAYAAVALARTDPDVAAIACYTRTGRSARILSSLRPRVPIVAFSPDPRVVARLALVHGVHPEPCSMTGEGVERLDLVPLVRERVRLPAGAAVVLVASTAGPGSGPNWLEIEHLGERLG